jgi:hypothetical protein
MRFPVLLLFAILLSSCIERQTRPAVELDRQDVAQVLDEWHQAATVADEDVYFGHMHPGAIFLGTDSAERWTKEEFMDFALPHFQKDTAWAFEVRHRDIYFDRSGQVAWFDEDLDTWMGTCRGSGVLSRFQQKWVIRHYNLAMLVPNERVQDYLEMMKTDSMPTP